MQQQMRQQQQRMAAGYAWQQQKKREMEAQQRAQAQRFGQPTAGPAWQESARLEPLPAAEPRQRSCLGTLAMVVGVLIMVGVCLGIIVLILSNL
jgi:ferric-dicitrate binding protein FerR (iron transport regulator)